MADSHASTGDRDRPALDHQGESTFSGGTTAAVRTQGDGSIRVFTRRYRTVPLAFIVAFGGILSVGPTSENWAGDPTGIRVSTAIVTATFALLGWRIFRLAIKVRPGTVIVRNLWSTRWIDAKDVARFDPPRAVRRGGIRVVKNSGRYISASAFGVMNNFERSDRGKAETAELNAWLASQQRPAPPSPGRDTRPVHVAGRASNLLWRAWVAVLWLITAFAVTLAMSNILNPN